MFNRTSLSKISQVVCVCALVGIPGLTGSDFTVLGDRGGHSVEGRLVSLLGDSLTIARADAVIDTISFASLDGKSQNRVRYYFRAVEYEVADGSILRMDYTDPEKDALGGHTYPEMDLTRVSFRNLPGNRIEITLRFLEDLPKEPTDASPYRIWLSLDLDGDASTGEQERGGEGKDVAFALNGASYSDAWDYYKVPKSAVGKASDAAIEKIQAGSDGLTFVLSGSFIEETPLFRIALSTAARETRGVDTFPNFAWICFASEQWVHPEDR